jgi:hypothetical protein
MTIIYFLVFSVGCDLRNRIYHRIFHDQRICNDSGQTTNILIIVTKVSTYTMIEKFPFPRVGELHEVESWERGLPMHGEKN